VTGTPVFLQRLHPHIHAAHQLTGEMFRLQEAKFTSVFAGPKFPWGQAAEMRNEIVIAQPQHAFYTLIATPYVGDFDAEVPHMRSQLAFTGSITGFLTEALFAKPSEFPFETYLTFFRKYCGPC
jgi:hypothetical protein